jgi:VanZ family protein
MLTLRFRPLWIAASLLLVLSVVWGSLQTTIGAEVPQGFDKIEHFGAYAFLAVWFTGLFHRPRYWLVAAGLVALGLAMEIAQYAMQAGRFGDPYDLAANTVGVAIGVLLGLVATGGWAQRVEAWLTAS